MTINEIATEEDIKQLRARHRNDPAVLAIIDRLAAYRQEADENAAWKKEMVGLLKEKRKFDKKIDEMW